MARRSQKRRSQEQRKNFRWAAEAERSFVDAWEKSGRSTAEEAVARRTVELYERSLQAEAEQGSVGQVHADDVAAQVRLDTFNQSVSLVKQLEWRVRAYYLLASASRVRSRVSPEAALDIWSLFLPRRVATEELGDYIEAINRRRLRGERVLPWILAASAVFWTGLNAVGYAVQLWKGRSTT